MFGKQQEFELPEMPGVCLTCGARGTLTPVKFEFRYTTAMSTLLTFFSPLMGSLYSRRMAYHLELPICGMCSGQLGRAKNVAVLACLLFLPVLLLAVLLIDFGLLLFFAPLVYIIAAYVYYGVVRGRGTPKTVRVNRDHLVLSVPDYGEFVVFESEPPAGKQARPQAAPDGPQLNRSICQDCGFINFVSASECKKCRAPLGQPAAAAV